jgi:hypothetical protein
MTASGIFRSFQASSLTPVRLPHNYSKQLSTPTSAVARPHRYNTEQDDQHHDSRDRISVCHPDDDGHCNH